MIPDLSSSSVRRPNFHHIHDVAGRLASFGRFFTESAWAQRADARQGCDFVFGNPHEPPVPGFVEALQRALMPGDNNWFAYKQSEPEARAVVAASLRRRRSVEYAPEDIVMTNGAFAGLAVVLKALTNPGDEVIYISPPWFFYEGMITDVGATAVGVKADPATFDLDLAAIEAAISPRTRAIIVNSPNNPTGKIYPATTLTQLGELLTRASREHDRPIYLLSDEAYSRILFDGRDFPSPTEYYPYSLLIYTYGKTLLTPGQRIGYVALPPTLPDREQLGDLLMTAQFVTGYAFPNALLQHALPDLEELSIDIEHFQHKRDRMVSALREMGYELHVPEGTFYLMVRSPLPDDVAFLDRLAAHQVYCLPGQVVETPGYFRISITASEEMIERALPGFAAAIEEVRG
jgi:aspartate aminotransferase